MPHTHTIDGKILTFDDATCPYCHPQVPQQQPEDQKEVLPRAYRKGDTIVLKISKLTQIIVNYYSDKQCYLMTHQHILRDANEKIVFDENKNPLWDKHTVRIPPTVLQTFLTLVSTLYSEIQNQQTVPKRD